MAQNQVPQPQTPLPPVGDYMTKANAYKAFMHMKPPTYEGERNPAIAEMWLKQVKKALTIVATPEQYKVEFATYLLKGMADNWWERVKPPGKMNICCEKISRICLIMNSTHNHK